MYSVIYNGYWTKKSCSSALYNINSQLKNSWQRQVWGRRGSLLQYHNVRGWLERTEMGCWVAMTTLWEGNGIARRWQFSFQSPWFLQRWHNEWVSLGQTFELPMLAGLGLVFHFRDSNLISEVGTACVWLNRMLSSVNQRAKPYTHRG